MTLLSMLITSPLTICCSLLFLPFTVVKGDCLSDSTLNDFFLDPDDPNDALPREGSCCQSDICGLACPEVLDDPVAGYGIAVGIAIGLSFAIGVWTSTQVHGEAENYFIAGKSLPLWIVSMTLGAQAIESGGLLGNVDLSYRYHFFDGAMIPIGLGCSLLINAATFASKLNSEPNVLTLPDVFAKKYGKVVEVLVSLICIVSFIMLLAANLSGLGQITGYVWGISVRAGIWMAAVIVWAYTISGGLFSVAYTDVVQGAVGWSGCVVAAYYLIANKPEAPGPSVGFPGYVYPSQELCNLYDGALCEFVEDGCCYNTSKWCSDPEDFSTCTAIDNGAYPIGDKRVFGDQMFDPQSLTPFPNAIFFNWVTFIVLALGNLAALDFQVRCMAANTPRAATLGCVIGGCFTFFVGVPFSFLGGITRVFYGPDSPRAEFDADTCSEILGLPTCGAWVPDDSAFVKLLTHETPAFLGAWCLIGIVAASMSTADGAILAMGTAWAHNIVRQFDIYMPNLVTPENLLMAARVSTIPLTLASTIIADQVRNTGYLLIVAFDIVLAAVVAPLFGAYYTKNPSPRAAFVSVVTGALTRVILEFSLPKDGYLVLPYDKPEFVDYGTAASVNYPVFFDQPEEFLWDPVSEPCDHVQLEDYTGVDSLAAFIASILAFVVIQAIENPEKPMFNFAGLQGYDKVLKSEEEHVDEAKRVKEDSNEEEEEQEVDDGEPEEVADA